MASIVSIAQNKSDALSQALTCLGEGKPIAIPTETVYGLAADATNPAAITAIYETKGRPSFNPLICHMADVQMAKLHAEFDDISLMLATHFWPGAMTLVLPLRPKSDIHKLATAGLSSVGIRVPKGFTAELIAQFGKPLAAPSANLSGKISPTTVQHVARDLGQSIDLILDGGACEHGVESTIIKIENGKAHLLRPGSIAAQDIENVIKQKLIRAGADSEIEAPGMLTSHYAPNTNLQLNVTRIEAGDVLIKFGNQPVDGEQDAAQIFNLSPAGHLKEAAHHLFDMLIKADQLTPNKIAVCAIPYEGLGEAINDRLKRAAAPKGQDNL